MIDLPAFNLSSLCPKCGLTGGGPRRLSPAVMAPPPPPPEDPFPIHYCKATLIVPQCSLDLPVEHLHRTCPRCGFVWAEACVEATP